VLRHTGTLDREGKSLDGSHDITNLIGRICDANQTQLVISAEYGG